MIDVHFDEGGFDHVLGGSVGIGEVATVPTSPAIANAIHNATGVRPAELPIRPTASSPHSKGGPPHEPVSHDRHASRRIPAAGTDLSGAAGAAAVSTGPLIDISATPDTNGTHWAADGSLRIGAFTTIAAIAT
jgi:hypothetical protein